MPRIKKNIIDGMKANLNQVFTIKLSCKPVKIGNKARVIKLAQVVNPKLANIEVNARGEIWPYRNGTPSALSSEPFFVTDENSGCKVIYMKAEGFIYSICFWRVFQMVFDSEFLESDKLPKRILEQKQAFEKMKHNREFLGIKPKFRAKKERAE